MTATGKVVGVVAGGEARDEEVRWVGRMGWKVEVTKLIVVDPRASTLSEVQRSPVHLLKRSSYADKPLPKLRNPPDSAGTLDGTLGSHLRRTHCEMAQNRMPKRGGPLSSRLVEVAGCRMFAVEPLAESRKSDGLGRVVDMARK